jgi:hypothetical protein
MVPFFSTVQCTCSKSGVNICFFWKVLKGLPPFPLPVGEDRASVIRMWFIRFTLNACCFLSQHFFWKAPIIVVLAGPLNLLQLHYVCCLFGHPPFCAYAWSRFLIEKLIVAQVVKNYLSFYGTNRLKSVVLKLDSAKASLGFRQILMKA